MIKAEQRKMVWMELYLAAVKCCEEDHLGSTMLITNESGEVVQRIEYLPSGEVFLDEKNESWNTPYKFNGKEYDEETGLYYYGARYYDPRLSLWLGTDPMQDKYPGISTYCYTMGNPVNATDSDGRLIIFINGLHGGTGGRSLYWNGLDIIITNWLHDHHVSYYDGSSGGSANIFFHGLLTGNVNPYMRKHWGHIMGYGQAAQIFACLSDNEKIRFVTHSMGAAYAKGFIEGLKEYADRNGIDMTNMIDLEIDLAPFQPTLQEGNSEVEQTFVIAHRYDRVAFYSAMPKTNHTVTRTDKKYRTLNPAKEHSVDSFTEEEIHLYIPQGDSRSKTINRIWEEKGIYKQR